MKASEAMIRASLIADCLVRGSENLKSTKMPFIHGLAREVIIKVTKGELSLAAADPAICEILIFGSLARGEELVSDVDLMMFDNGFYSEAFLNKNDDQVDVYSTLRGNFGLIMDKWFNLGLGGELLAEFIDRVDLHVLPVSFFKSLDIRKEIAERHRDQFFLQNAFEYIWRYDFSRKCFQPIHLAFLEEKYKGSLEDLRLRRRHGRLRHLRN